MSGRRIEGCTDKVLTMHFCLQVLSGTVEGVSSRANELTKTDRSKVINSLQFLNNYYK